MTKSAAPQNDQMMPNTLPFKMGSVLRRLSPNNGCWEFTTVEAAKWDPVHKAARVRVPSDDPKTQHDILLTVNDMKAAAGGKLSVWHLCPPEFLGENLQGGVLEPTLAPLQDEIKWMQDTIRETRTDMEKLKEENKSLVAQMRDLAVRVKNTPATLPGPTPVPGPVPGPVSTPRNGAPFRNLGWKQVDVDALSEPDWARLQTERKSKDKFVRTVGV